MPSCEGGQQARWLRPPLLQAQHSAEISACPARVCPACARENRDDRLRSHRMSGCRDVVSVSHGCAACTVRTNAATRRWESAERRASRRAFDFARPAVTRRSECVHRPEVQSSVQWRTRECTVAVACARACECRHTAWRSCFGWCNGESHLVKAEEHTPPQMYTQARTSGSLVLSPGLSALAPDMCARPTRPCARLFSQDRR